VNSFRVYVKLDRGDLPPQAEGDVLDGHAGLVKSKTVVCSLAKPTSMLSIL